MVLFQSSFAILFQFSILTSTHKHHKISIQYPSHKCLPQKSGLHCLKILIMSCFRIQLTVAWLNLTMPNETVKNGIKAKKIKLPQMNIFLEKLIKFSCAYWPLSLCKIFKKFFEPVQSYEDVPFSDPKWSICPEIFFGTNPY